MCWSVGDGVLGLENGIGNKTARVLVSKAIEHPGAVLPGSDDAGQAQLRQVLGDRGGRLVNDVRKVIDGELAVAQSENDSHSGGIGEHAEDLDRELDKGTVGVPPAKLLICIYMQIMSWSGAQNARSSTSRIVR